MIRYNFIGILLAKEVLPKGQNYISGEYPPNWYARNASKATLYGLVQSAEDYPYEDERGRYTSTDLTVGMDRYARPGQFYPITNPRTGVVYQPNPERVWRFYPEKSIWHSYL